MTAPAPAQTVTEKRRDFITFLYGVHRNLTADNRMPRPTAGPSSPAAPQLCRAPPAG